jgi:hypothetical protein
LRAGEHPGDIRRRAGGHLGGFWLPPGVIAGYRFLRSTPVSRWILR